MPEFKRPVQENYGPSSVRLEKLDMTSRFSSVKINGKDVVLPMLNLKKYYSSAECYAFIERMHNRPITMIDVLYTPSDILYRFENDEEYRKGLLAFFSREAIIKSNSEFSALAITPKDAATARPFVDAMKLAVQDAAGIQIFKVDKQFSESTEIDVAPNPNQVKRDSIAIEFIKDFYEIISNTRVRRPTDSRKKKVNCTIKKDAILMKSGAMLVGSEEMQRYYAKFYSEMEMSNLPDKKIINEHIAFHISDIDENLLMNSPEYIKEFGDVLLSSNALEAFGTSNQVNSKLNFFGKYNKKEKKLEVNKRIERYFDEINSELKLQRPDDEGR